MTATLADPIAEFDGMPFLDDSFNARRLLAAIAAVRYVKGRDLGVGGHITREGIEQWLAPAQAILLHPGAEPIPARPLGPRRQADVQGALAMVAGAMPTWSDLLALPTRFALLYPPTGAVSASRRMWPQHVLLSGEAFDSAQVLAELALLELTHQWLYLLLELWALQLPEATEHTLPSGTTGRQPWEVLGAAHVSLALARLYTHIPQQAKRVGPLRTYAAGCLDSLASRPELTPAGERVAQRLKEEL